MFSHKINNTGYIIVKLYTLVVHVPVDCVINNASISMYRPNFKIHDVHVLQLTGRYCSILKESCSYCNNPEIFQCKQA